MGLQGELTLGDPLPSRRAHLVKGWAAAGKDGLFMDHSSVVGPWSSFLSHRLVMYPNNVNLLTHWLARDFLQGKPKCKCPTLCTDLQLRCHFAQAHWLQHLRQTAPCLTHQEFCNCLQWGGSFCATSVGKGWSEGSEQRCIRISAQSSQQLYKRIGITLAGGLVAFLSSLSHAGGFCTCCYYCILQKMEKGKTSKERAHFFTRKHKLSVCQRAEEKSLCSLLSLLQ